YHVFLHDESNLGGQQIVARIETDKTSVVLSDPRPKRVGSIEPYLVAGRTGRWRGEAFDGAGRRGGKALKDGRILVARGFSEEGGAARHILFLPTGAGAPDAPSHPHGAGSCNVTGRRGEVQRGVISLWRRRRLGQF